MCGSLVKSVDGEGNCNYINLHTQLMLYERCHHTILIKSNEIM